MGGSCFDKRNRRSRPRKGEEAPFGDTERVAKRDLRVSATAMHPLDRLRPIIRLFAHDRSLGDPNGGHSRRAKCLNRPRAWYGNRGGFRDFFITQRRRFELLAHVNGSPSPTHGTVASQKCSNRLHVVWGMLRLNCRFVSFRQSLPCRSSFRAFRGCRAFGDEPGRPSTRPRFH